MPPCCPTPSPPTTSQPSYESNLLLISNLRKQDIFLSGLTLGPGAIPKPHKESQEEAEVAEESPGFIRGLLGPNLPDLEEGKLRVLAILGGDHTLDGTSAIPEDSYRIDPGGVFPYILANPASALWAGANEAPPGTPFNAAFARIEVECKSLCVSDPPTTGTSIRRTTRHPRAAQRGGEESKADNVPFIVMALVQTGPLGPKGETYVDYGDAYGKANHRDYDYSPDKRVKPDVTEDSLLDLANQYKTSVAAIAVAHGHPDTNPSGRIDPEASLIYEDSHHIPLSLPMEGIMASSLHRDGEVLFIEELFLTGANRGGGKGPLLIDYTWDHLPKITEIHLITDANSSKDSPESCYRRLGFSPVRLRKDRVFDYSIPRTKIYMSITRHRFREKREAYARSKGECHQPQPQELLDRIDLRKLDPQRPSHTTPESQGLNRILHELYQYHDYHTHRNYAVNLDPPNLSPNLIPVILGEATHLTSLFSTSAAITTPSPPHDPADGQTPPNSPPPSPPPSHQSPCPSPLPLPQSLPTLTQLLPSCISLSPPPPDPSPDHLPPTSPSTPPLSYPTLLPRRSGLFVKSAESLVPGDSPTLPMVVTASSHPGLKTVTSTAPQRVPLPEPLG